MAEKRLHEVSRAWRELYEKGKEAFNRNNLDYAISILTQVVEKEPSFYECREALRAAQFKKQGTGGGGFFKKVMGAATSSPMVAKAQMALRSNPLEAIHTAEEILNSDPSNAAAHKILAEGALLADLPKTAVLSLEILFKQSPKDRKITTLLADAYSRTGQVDRAESLYRELLRQTPDDPEISQSLKNVVANRTLQQQGYESLSGGTGSYRDILKNKEEAVSIEQGNRIVKDEDVLTKLILENEARLVAEPWNVRLMKATADLYVQQKNFDKGLEYYSKLKDTELGGDPSLEKAVVETSVKRFNHLIGQLDASAPDYADQKAAIEKERQNFQIAECQQRMARFPQDLQLRFELGVLLFQAGRIPEAIQEFQRSKDNPHRHISSLGYLGQCFAMRGMNDLAAKTLQSALMEKLMFDTEKKELTYQLGCVLEKMGKKNESIAEFKKIYEVDIGYKDVAAKVDAYYSGQQSA